MSENTAEKDAPFFWDTETGEPCPRRGNVLCDLPWTPSHRHAHREPPLSLAVVPGDKPWSVLDAVESLSRLTPPADPTPDAPRAARTEGL